MLKSATNTADEVFVRRLESTPTEVRRAILTLPAVQRDMLADVRKGWTYREIAHGRGLDERTVLLGLTDALKHLHHELSLSSPT